MHVGICMHFGTFWNILLTFWNILHAFWNILHAFWNSLEHSACILEHSACILEHSACMLEHSGTLCYYIECCKKVEFKLADRQTRHLDLLSCVFAAKNHYTWELLKNEGTLEGGDLNRLKVVIWGPEGGGLSQLKVMIRSVSPRMMRWSEELAWQPVPVHTAPRESMSTVPQAHKAQAGPRAGGVHQGRPSVWQKLL